MVISYFYEIFLFFWGGGVIIKNIYEKCKERWQCFVSVMGYFDLQLSMIVLLECEKRMKQFKCRKLG